MTEQLTRVPCGTNFDAVPVPFSLGTDSRFQCALNNWDVRAKGTSLMQASGQTRVEMQLERTTWFRSSKVNCSALVPSRVCQVLSEPQTAKKCGIIADQDVGPRLQTSRDKVHHKFLALVVLLFYGQVNCLLFVFSWSLFSEGIMLVLQQQTKWPRSSTKHQTDQINLWNLKCGQIW